MERKGRKVAIMDMIKVRASVDKDGLLKLEIPTNYHSIELEVALVLQPLQAQEKDALGWPVNFFEQIDAIQADHMEERPEQGDFEEREPLE
jgi:hypothetical protein